ncbi:MAG TPA: NAD(P)(+) transhydrogenase (Re/Si-specific) subunit beta [Candidatus Nanoarchaeia archaeon]|nr:NAD(P)(+) transhydrogenase (Re/Si-specific) subunit beta [Candidatus Nanoarchaeia archaeon]
MAVVELLYIISAALFILSLKWMSHVESSRRGNYAGSLGMLLAFIATVLAVAELRYDIVAYAIIAGGIIGAVMAMKMPMTAVPQRTAISHAFGAFAAALVGTAEYLQNNLSIDKFTMGVISAEVILGFLTFTGSIIAFAKLQEMISGKPLIYPGRRIVTFSILAGAVLCAVLLVIAPQKQFVFVIMSVLSLIFGLLMVISIGGADMPTVIAILNSFAGLSASALGFVLNNKLLIVAGALDGSSGFILAIIMSKAMNRSFLNILFGGFGAASSKNGQKGSVRPISSDDTYSILEAAQSVVIVPGYGMAVAQAQHAVRELASMLEKNGAEVRYAIHPVAGRMPGHMNVLLAEANVPYDQLVEMDSINPIMDTIDVAIVIGANDVVNPSARTDKSSPIYGMPVIDVEKARTAIVLKRSMASGFSGVENPLFFKETTRMLFGDAKDSLNQLVAKFKENK